jgi:hypothetical protein
VGLGEDVDKVLKMWSVCCRNVVIVRNVECTARKEFRT